MLSAESGFQINMRKFPTALFINFLALSIVILTGNARITTRTLSSIVENADMTIEFISRNNTNITCPDLDYVHLNGSCYKYVSTPLNFYEANISCIKDFGYLVEIHSAIEQTLIWNYIYPLHDFREKYYNGPYIGLSNIKSGGRDYYEWTTGSKVDYVIWDYDFPKYQDGYEYCTVLGLDGTWATIPCDWEKSYICEMSIDTQIKNSQNNLIKFFSSSSNVFLVIPCLILLFGFIFYAGTCTYQKRTVSPLKSIRLKLPKLSLPFNKKMSDYKPYEENTESIQFNCFGPDESSEDEPAWTNDGSRSKLRASLIK